MERFITVKEAAEMISCKPATVYKYAQRKQLPSVKIAGLRRFRPRDIESFINRFVSIKQ